MNNNNNNKDLKGLLPSLVCMGPWDCYPVPWKTQNQGQSNTLMHNIQGNITDEALAFRVRETNQFRSGKHSVPMPESLRKSFMGEVKISTPPNFVSTAIVGDLAYCVKSRHVIDSHHLWREVSWKIYKRIQRGRIEHILPINIFICCLCLQWGLQRFTLVDLEYHRLFCSLSVSWSWRKQMDQKYVPTPAKCSKWVLIPGSIFNTVRWERPLLFHLNFLCESLLVAGVPGNVQSPYWCFLEHELTNIYLSKVKGISNDPSWHLFSAFHSVNPKSSTGWFTGCP